MKLKSVVCIAGSVSVLMLAGVLNNAYADWPEKPVRVIVPFGPGGGTDLQGRLLGKKFYESMGQTFVVDNKPGAAGLIGADIVVKSPPDGYTILFTTASLSVNTTLYKKSIQFDPVKDLVPVSWLSSVPLVLVTHPTVPAKSVSELIALARRSGRLNAGSNGAGTTSYLAVEAFKQDTGAQVTNVPYKGGGPAMNALLSGEVDFQFATALSAAPQIKAGRVRALAVTTAKRAAAFPDLPTMDSLYPGFNIDNWYAMFFPAGTPQAIVNKMHDEIVKALKAPDVVEYMAKEGGEPVGSTPQELATMFGQEVNKYATLIDKAHIAAQ